MNKANNPIAESNDNKPERNLVDGVDPKSLMMASDGSDEVPVKAVLLGTAGAGIEGKRCWGVAGGDITCRSLHPWHPSELV